MIACAVGPGRPGSRQHLPRPERPLDQGQEPAASRVQSRAGSAWLAPQVVRSLPIAEFGDRVFTVIGIVAPLAVPDLVIHASKTDLHGLQPAFDLECCDYDKRANPDDHLLSDVQIKSP